MAIARQMREVTNENQKDLEDAASDVSYLLDVIELQAKEGLDFKVEDELTAREISVLRRLGYKVEIIQSVAWQEFTVMISW